MSYDSDTRWKAIAWSVVAICVCVVICFCVFCAYSYPTPASERFGERVEKLERRVSKLETFSSTIEVISRTRNELRVDEKRKGDE